jgi:hypothetical protein
VAFSDENESDENESFLKKVYFKKGVFLHYTQKNPHLNPYIFLFYVFLNEKYYFDPVF